MGRAEPDGLPRGALLAGAALFTAGRLSPGAWCVLTVLDCWGGAAPACRIGTRELARRARVDRHRLPDLIEELREVLPGRFTATVPPRRRALYRMAKHQTGASEAPVLGGRAATGASDAPVADELVRQTHQTGASDAPGILPTGIPPADGAPAEPPTGLRPEPPAAAPGAPVPAVGGRHGSGASPRGPRQGAGAGGAPAPPIGTVSAADVAAAQGRALLRARRNGS